MSKSFRKDLTGKRFGALVVIEFVPNDAPCSYWRCRCDCGNEIVVGVCNLKRTNTRSCGSRKCKMTNTKHRLSKTRLYRIYNNMRYRCFKKYAKEYEIYCNKKVCPEWIDKENGFLNFYNWALANGYREDLTLDRIDNNKGYSPDNCRWADMKTQQNNKSNNRLITYKGETHNVAEWVSITGIPRGTLVKRLNNGWDIEKALTNPVDKKFSRTKTK